MPEEPMKYECFHLVLMVTHGCNLQCDYCYTGRKFPRAMTLEVGRAALNRAVRAIRPGGVLELGFFGGEPLLEAELIAELVDYAQEATEPAGIRLRPGLTTNGTLLTASAWKVMMLDGLDLCVSHDGRPETHDRHRRAAANGSAEQVMGTIHRVQDAGREVRVVTVVRPDSAASLPEDIQWLRGRNVRRIDLTLDVWAPWERRDAERLEEALVRTADLWQAGLPDCAINWFDEKAAHLMGIPIEPTARCGFGDGEIAVAPSGNLYPCERLIGEDGADHPMRLPGHATDEGDFCRDPAPGRSAAACSACAIQGQCNTTCRCNNYVRTGDIERPDALLCLLDRVCYRETARVLRRLQVARGTPCSS
jgi:uncharacterized protein